MRLRPAAVALALASCSAPPPAPAPVAPEAAIPPPTLRLPTYARPLRYDLDLTVLPGARTFTGRVAVDLSVSEPTRHLWLNATKLTITEAHLRGEGGRVEARVIPGGDDFVGFAFDAPVEAGPARFVVRYEGPIDAEASRGIYQQREGDGGYYAYTFFEPLDARRAFPCFDEPAYKVPWKLTLHVAADHVALANAPIAGETAEPGHRKAVAFAESRPMPSYLVAFVVGPFDVVDAGTAGHHATPLRFVVPRGRGAETRYAASITPRIVGLLEDYFGMPYPYGKLDVAVVPRYWGTMEHPGLVALGQPLTLIEPAEETPQRRQRYANIAAHELAHYWFGDYVTMAWWDDTWLNEALATWIDAKVTSELEPSWRFAEASPHAPSAMAADALAGAKRIRQPIVTKHDIEDAFDGDITYAKGAAVLGMFERWLGPEVFQRGVRRYVREHAWGSATTDHLLAALEAEAGRAVAPAFKSFLDQPGVPDVAASVVCKPGAPPRLALAQSRFVPAGSSASASAVWTVPVCVRWGHGEKSGRACVLLDRAAAEVPLEGATGCPDWLVPNEAGAGYYRARTPIEALRKLLGPFKDKLTVAERAALLDDAAARTGAGTLAIGDALSLLPPLAAGAGRVELERGFAILGAVRPDNLPPELRARFARFLDRTYGARARALGFRARPGDTPDDLLLRPRLLGLVGGPGEDPALRREARDLVLRWLDDRAAVPAEVLEAALSLAGRSGDRALFDRLRRAALSTGYRPDAARFARALGTFGDPALCREALALILGAELDLRESIGILEAALEGRETREAAWSFLRDHFDELSRRMRADEAVELLRSPAVFCDEAHRAEAAAFLGPRAEKVEGAPRVVASVLEEIRVCAADAAQKRAGLEAFLAGY